MTREEIEKRFAHLYCGTHHCSREEAVAVCVATSALIRALAPCDTTFAEHLDRLAKLFTKPAEQGLAEHRTALGDLVDEARRHYCGGFHRIRGSIQTCVFADLLDQADYLHGEGWHIAAGSVCGAVLEDTLRKIHQNAIGPWQGDSTISKVNSALYAEHAAGRLPSYDNACQLQVTSWGVLRNSIDHHKFQKPEDIDPARVKLMIEGVRLFIATHLS